MILKSSYRSGRGCSARALTEYISRHRNFEVRDREGNVLSQEEIDKFIEKSETKENNFEREFILSPDNHDIAVDPMSDYTREGVERWIAEGNRGSVDYIYCIHYDKEDHPHVHVAMTGKKKDLYMDKSDLQHVQDNVFAKAFGEPEHHKGLYRDDSLLREPEKELEREIGLGL